MVEMKSIYCKDDLCGIWEEMWCKINDLMLFLFLGVYLFKIIDDFVDVYGMFIVVMGDGY